MCDNYTHSICNHFFLLYLVNQKVLPYLTLPRGGLMPSTESNVVHTNGGCT